MFSLISSSLPYLKVSNFSLHKDYGEWKVKPFENSNYAVSTVIIITAINVLISSQDLGKNL